MIDVSALLVFSHFAALAYAGAPPQKKKEGEPMAKGKYQEWLTPEGLLKIEGWARDGLKRR